MDRETESRIGSLVQVFGENCAARISKNGQREKTSWRRTESKIPWKGETRADSAAAASVRGPSDWINSLYREAHTIPWDLRKNIVDGTQIKKIRQCKRVRGVRGTPAAATIKARYRTSVLTKQSQEGTCANQRV